MNDYKFIWEYILKQFEDEKSFSAQDVRNGLTLIVSYDPTFKQAESKDFNLSTWLEKVPVILLDMVNAGLLTRYAPDPLYVRYAVISKA